MGIQLKPYRYDRIRSKALKGPRVTSLLERFERIASGVEQRPSQPVLAEPAFLERDEEYKKYHQILQKDMGTFARHGFASIPFLLEEVIRVGTAIQHCAESCNASLEKPFTYYETSSADGTVGRSLAEYAGGTVRTLTDSPNESNRLEFYKLLSHNYSCFHKGPFVDITPEYLSQAYDGVFKDGFDVIWENTTFQMYGDNREEQIAYVSRLLKESGLMIFHEKMNNSDQEAYAQFEELKDSKFKSRYFTKKELDQKQSAILSEMKAGQVTLDEFKGALKPHFDHAYVIWNSGNFYEICVSNSKETIERFLSFLPEPYVPESFIVSTPIVRPLLL